MSAVLPGRTHSTGPSSRPSPGRSSRRSAGPTRWRWLRAASGTVVVLVLLARFGPGPVERGLRLVGPQVLGSALLLTAAATLCCAWRWRAVATALGAGIGLREAYLACYGSQFLNATLPAGVLGDVHRALAHGRRTGSPARAARGVVWERTWGLAVQVVVTTAVVALWSEHLRPAAVVVGLVGLAGAVVAVRWRPVSAEVARVLRRPGVAAAVLVSSLGVLACHTAVLLMVMAATDVTASAAPALPLALAVLLGAAVPTSVAGWGPREGVAVWVFAACGLPGADGLAVSVAFGVASLAGTLPGAVALLLTRRRPIEPGAGRD